MTSKHILHWDDERNIGNGVIVTLNDGWCFDMPNSGEHVMGFDTVTEARKETAQKRLYKCGCKECAQ